MRVFSCAPSGLAFGLTGRRAVALAALRAEEASR